LLLCSAGDFYGTADEFNEPKSRFVARMMGYLKYDAIGVGEMDLNYGLAVLQEDVATYGLPVTCANLIAKGELEPDAGSVQKRLGTVFPPYLVVERDGVRFGFVGLISPETKARQRRADGQPSRVEGINYIIEDPREAAEAVIPLARKACDVLILLAHMDRTELDKLLPDFPQVSIAVIGHEPRTTAIGVPEQVGEAMLVKATSQGQNIGRLQFSVGDDGRITDVHNTIAFLNDKYPDDPDVVAMLDEFDVENRKIQKVLFAKSQLRASKGQKESSRYLGVGACQTCHAEAFEVYSKTAHAHAFQTLAAQFVHRDTNCVGCHVTGWKDRGGFDGRQHRGAGVDLIDVQCEACHGPGSEHRRDGSYARAAVESCVRCHTKNDDPDFDFDTDWPKIAH